MLSKISFNQDFVLFSKIQGGFLTGPPLKVLSTKTLIKARLGVSGTIYVNVDSPNLAFPYFNFFGWYQLKESPCIIYKISYDTTYHI